MKFDSTAFNQEFLNVLSFWEKNWVLDNSDNFIGEMSINGDVNKDALKGSMYLSRILYGTSIACKEFNTKQYENIADDCFNLLQESFINPRGGYFWSLDSQGKVVHSADNANLGQAFVLYGLTEYAALKKDERIDSIARIHAEFLYQAIADSKNGGYLDGFDENWNLLAEQNKDLGTHLHMLEAYTKWYEYSKEPKWEGIIEGLLRNIIDHFITKDTYDCIHLLSSDWNPLPNDIWAGHNAECSWIICNSARFINNTLLIAECDDLALKMMDAVIKYAIDKQSGAVYNVMDNNKPIEESINWWPPAETVIGLLNAYQISGSDKYLDQAEKVQRFISNKIISPKGEWYANVYPDGKPVDSEPLIHFWKSAYHNVRYYVEVSRRMKQL